MGKSIVGCLTVFLLGYIVYSDDQSSCVVIDPSVSYDFVFRQRKSLPKVEKILLTHAHFDHVLCLAEWREKTASPVCISAQDASSLYDGEKNGYSFFFGGDKSFGCADELLSEGDAICFGDSKLTFLHTPGHTQGSGCFLGEGLIFTGDTIFADGGVGRTDLYGGSGKSLISSLKRLFALDENYRLLSGHGPETTIKEEKYNHGYNF